MLLKKVGFLAALVSVCLGTSSAHAVLIGGVEYDQILSISSNDRLGYWISMDKFYTYDNVANSPISIAGVPVRSNELAGVVFKEVYAMGTTIGDNGPVNSGVVNLYGANNQVLLTTTLVPNGTISATRIMGTAGQLNVSGTYNITGGSLFTSGLLAGQLLIQAAFDNVVGLGGNDIHATAGTFNFYRRSGGEGQVPEPASVALLLSGLGALKLRRKQSA